MNTSFRSVAANRFDRNFGGTDKGTADPYISGYHFVMFHVLPSKLYDFITKNDAFGSAAHFTSKQDIKNVLSGSNVSLTPVGGTLNGTEFIGLGGTKWGAPTSLDYGNSLTMRFVEFSGTPLLAIFHSWVRMIREYRTGTSALQGSDYSKSSYASTILYWTTKPDGYTVEYAAAFTGAWPTKDPQDLYTGDLASNEKLELDMEFRFDYPWHETWVRDQCQRYASTFAAEGVRIHGGAKIGSSVQAANPNILAHSS